MSSRSRNARIYVGNLPPDIRVSDVEELFDSRKYGKVLDIDLKNEKGPPFAFVEFEHQDDADYAVEKRNGYDYDGYKLRVEYPKGGSSNDRYSRRDGGGYSGYDRGYGGRGRGRGGGGYDSRSKYRVCVSGLPKSGSWQDLKDHMREAGDVLHTDVFRNGSGVCDFKTMEAMRYAIDKLHDSKFTSHENETSYISVRSSTESSSRYRSRSRSRSRSRTRSRSRDRRRRSRSRSSGRRYRDRSRTPSRSRSRSRSRSDRARTRSRTGST